MVSLLQKSSKVSFFSQSARAPLLLRHRNCTILGFPVPLISETKSIPQCSLLEFPFLQGNFLRASRSFYFGKQEHPYVQRARVCFLPGQFYMGPLFSHSRHCGMLEDSSSISKSNHVGRMLFALTKPLKNCYEFTDRL